MIRTSRPSIAAVPNLRSRERLGIERSEAAENAGGEVGELTQRRVRARSVVRHDAGPTQAATTSGHGAGWQVAQITTPYVDRQNW